MKIYSFFAVTCMLLIFFFISICTSAYSHEWHTANQVTITWEAITSLSDGTPIPEVDTIEYKVWLANTLTDPDKTNPVEVGVTSETLYVITLTTEGRFFVGLQTLRTSQEELVSESRIGWTDEPEIVLDGVTFGLQYFLPPAPPFGVSLF